MKKLTLLIVCMAIFGLSYGQSVVKGVPQPVKDETVQSTPAFNSIKGSGDVFWSTTFNWGNPETKEWTLPEGWVIADLSDLGNPWIWRSPYDTLGGCCTWQGPSSNFTTPLDGYIVVPADEYNRRDGVGSSNPMNTYIITPPINCSGKSSVVVKFKQLFRLCCAAADLKMLITNDAGVHWAEYDCRFGLSMNRVTDARYQNVEFNISDVAAGLPNVQIKFYLNGNSHYYWMIDDLSLSEAYQNDLILADYWAKFNGGFDERIGHINFWPKSQMGMATDVGGNIGDYEFTGAFLNNGMADQENARLQMTVLKNGTQVYQDVSNPSTIWPLERDTLTDNSVFLADDYGDYQFIFKGISDNTEEVPVNNEISQRFTVNDTLFHRADFTAEAGSNTGGWVGGANAGDMVGVFYDIYKPCEINSITALIAGVTVAETPQYQYVLLKDMGQDGLVEWLVSDLVDATAEMRWTWQTLAMLKDGETEFLEPGTYVACVRFWGTKEGDADGTNGMSIGWDMDNNQGNYTYNYQSVGGNWFNTGKMNLIGVNINETGAPSQAPVTFNVDMNRHIKNGEFNPGSDKVDVYGVGASWTGTADMTDPDGDGIYSVTVEGMPVARILEFKYRVNGIEEAYAFSGGPYRKYTVRYWNILNHVYNNGITTGIPSETLTESFRVYPNPTEGKFTVSITNRIPASVDITLINSQGRVVYSHQVPDVAGYSETIDNQLAKGIYFLRINNGSEIKIQKLVVN